MKTRHIIAIGLLSATAVALLSIGLAKSNKKPKPLQTKAEETPLTDLSNTAWTLNETLSNYDPAGNNMTTGNHQRNYNISGFTQEQNITQISFTTNFTMYTFVINLNNQYSYVATSIFNWTGWKENKIPTIYIKNGTDATNTQLITWIQNNATRQPFIETAYANGQTAGYQTGYTAGESAGYTAGETAGYETGYTAGESAGYTAGETAGYQTGYTAGETAGYQTGYTIGETAGYENGYQYGYTDGYNEGYAIGYTDAGIYNEVIDLRGTMLQILTMPFTFITQAFDVTIFPGTPYAFNFSRLIMGILAISAILFIIKLFTSGLSIIGNYTTNIKKESTMRSDNRKSKQAYKAAKTAKKAQQINKDN